MSDVLKMIPVVLAVVVLGGVILWANYTYQQITRELEQQPDVELPTAEFESPLADPERGLGSGFPEDDWRNKPLKLQP